MVHPPPHVALVGLAGVGKTSVGRALAKALGCSFVDTDAEIVRRRGASVAEIFATDGEAAFRVLESEVLAELLATAEPLVLATGGGAVLAPANRDELKRHAVTVWLRAPLGVLLSRLSSAQDERPLLAGDAATKLAAQEEERSALYAEVADLELDVELAGATDTATAILESLGRLRGGVTAASSEAQS